MRRGIVGISWKFLADSGKACIVLHKPGSTTFISRSRAFMAISDRAEGFAVIRDYRSAGYSRPTIIQLLVSEGVAQSTAYSWFKKLDELESPDDALEAVTAVMQQALQREDHELVLKAAIAKAKLLK